MLGTESEEQPEEIPSLPARALLCPLQPDLYLNVSCFKCIEKNNKLIRKSIWIFHETKKSVMLVFLLNGTKILVNFVLVYMQSLLLRITY